MRSLSLILAALVASSASYYTANVIVVNLLNTTLVFHGCSTSANGTLPVHPDSVLAQQTTRLFINTSESFEDVSGYCWWEAAGYGLCDPNIPPKPVTSCPYIGWQRTVIVGQEDISWEAETPGHVGIGDVTITKRVGHQSKIYCFCDPSDTDCQKTCVDL
eukprot:m.11353 g.11353  ORF g.11353 m.11353 type:complete len:160 (-) comp9796_c0_seq1:105-584(-)